MIISRPLDDLRIYDRRNGLPLDRSIGEYKQTPGGKPHGLWFSVQADWDRWCRDNEMGWTDDVTVWKVHVNPLDALLHISSMDELDAFTQTYDHPRDVSWSRFGDCIDWPAVAAKYPGVVVHQYFYDWQRDNAPWHYGWDCASGCIWDLDVVRAVTPIFHSSDLR